jgi:hypothetical protein
MHSLLSSVYFFFDIGRGRGLIQPPSPPSPEGFLFIEKKHLTEMCDELTRFRQTGRQINGTRCRGSERVQAERMRHDKKNKEGMQMATAVRLVQRGFTRAKSLLLFLFLLYHSTYREMKKNYHPLVRISIPPILPYGLFLFYFPSFLYCLVYVVLLV